MIYTIVIILVVALILVAVAVNAIQQHKERMEQERRQEILKQKAIIEETEAVLVNSANSPVSSSLINILQNRIYVALTTSLELQPDSTSIKQRLDDMKNRKEASTANDKNLDDAPVNLPEADQQIISLVQNIKKLRSILRSEHSKGKIDTQVFLAEDKRLEKVQLQVNIDSQVKRGKKAMASNMLGSARQYFEKALQTLEAQPYTDTYISSRKAEIASSLEQITNELKSANAATAQKNSEKSELDELFAPKRKW